MTNTQEMEIEAMKLYSIEEAAKLIGYTGRMGVKYLIDSKYLKKGIDYESTRTPRGYEKVSIRGSAILRIKEQKYKSSKYE